MSLYAQLMTYLTSTRSFRCGNGFIKLIFSPRLSGITDANLLKNINCRFGLKFVARKLLHKYKSCKWMTRFLNYFQ